VTPGAVPSPGAIALSIDWVAMPHLPHDISDLYLAPVLLELEDQLEELGSLDAEQLRFSVGLTSASTSDDLEDRKAGLLRAILDAVDLRGWEATWDVRGLRLTHSSHTFVLGLPPNFAVFLAGN